MRQQFQGNGEYNEKRPPLLPTRTDNNLIWILHARLRHAKMKEQLDGTDRNKAAFSAGVN